MIIEGGFPSNQMIILFDDIIRNHGGLEHGEIGFTDIFHIVEFLPVKFFLNKEGS